MPDPEYSDVPVLAKTVRDRILKSDVWLSRCSGNQEFLKRDLAEVRAALTAEGRPENDVKFGHCQFTYVVDTNDREKALAAQKPFFEQVMGTHRTYEHLQECYLLGSVDDIVNRMLELKELGMEYLLIGPVSDDLEQLDLINELIIPRLR
jgi:alkanesulfonate monooxygenase SsuD/methylene tetrahydromethanopterin reductase-like flavin-dependent oxidoreductase (luciferase family)